MDKLPQLILSRFRGRADHIAVGTSGGFEPERSAINADRLVREHLSGGRCLGFYLLDEQSHCYCSCVDFDNKEKADPAWQAKAESVYFGLMGVELTPLIELSQSGNGCHVWLFFDEPTDAWVPRAFWRAVSRRVGVDFKEIFPKQDRLTGKGMGNLVRYPLWNQSAFVDVEAGWMPIDPCEAIEAIKPTSGTDLCLLAFQCGMGELSPEQRIEATVIADTGELLPTRVQRLIEARNSLLARRWAGDATGMKDTSKSAIAMSVAVELVRLYVPTPEITAALRNWCMRHGAEEKGKREDWINRTVAKAYDFVIQRTERKSLDVGTFQSAAHAYLDRLESGREIYVPSGIGELDASIDGVGPGEVCIIAGRPSHGKSAIGFQWLASASGLGISGLIISEEMGALEIGKRRCLSISEIDCEQWVAASVAHMRREIDEYHKERKPVYIVESCGTIDRTEEIIDQFCTLHDIGLIMVDYLQLLGGRNVDRYEVVTEVSRRIKQAARRNNVAILLLSQLNRQVEHREDNEPRLSDLRESGQVEQDADLVLFGQYPCRFDVEMPPDVYRIWAAKRRNGPIRQPCIETKFNPQRQIIGMPKLPAEILDL